MILIDTSVLSRTFRRKQPAAKELALRGAVERLLSGDLALGLPGVVLQEVLSGIRSDKQFMSLQQRLLGSFTIIHATTEDCVAAARLRNHCASKGLNVSGPDCLIATLTIAGRHQLLSMDDDFVQIAKVSSLKLLAVEDV